MKPAFTGEVVALLVVLVPTIVLTGIAVVAQLTRVSVRLASEARVSIEAVGSVHRRLMAAEADVWEEQMRRRRQKLDQIHAGVSRPSTHLTFGDRQQARVASE